MLPASARITRLQHGDSGQNSKHFESGRGEISRMTAGEIPSESFIRIVQQQSSAPLAQESWISSPLMHSSEYQNSSFPLNDLPKFSGEGKDDLDSWISLVERYLKQYPRTMSYQVDIVLFALSGVARDAILNYGDFSSVEQIFETLRSIFLPSVNKMHRLAQAKQGSNELVTIFYSRLRKYVRKIGSMSEESFEEITLYFFLGGLRLEISKRFSSDVPKTLDQALSKAKEIEGELGCQRELKNDYLSANRSGLNSSETETEVPHQVALLQDILNRLESLP
jgi:hypothetical protein